MRISILYGNPLSEKGEFNNYLDKLKVELEKENTVDLFFLDEMDLKYCSGCWSCWWKTPGKCIFKDGSDNIFKSVINSDFVIFASPLIAGFTSSSLKKITDRLIVLLHPYIKLINGESHHRKRYDNYPSFGLLLKKEFDTDEEDIQIVKDIYDRLAINFHSSQRYIKFIEEHSVEEVAFESNFKKLAYAV
jgi:hypothetical protein